MLHATKRLLPGALLVLAGPTAAVWAQNPNFQALTSPNPPAYALTPPPAYGAGFNQPPIAAPYYPYNYYGGAGGAYNGYLTGAASVIGQQGQFMIDTQQSNLLKEQVKSSKLDTRRKALDEWLYERAVTPTTEDERERNRLENLRRSLNDPPVTEIWSGKALNDILLSIQQNLARRLMGPPVPLSPDVVSHINVTTGATVGSIGLLRDGGKLRWPLQLKKSSFADQRQRLDELAPQAWKEAQAGEVSDETLEGMIDAQKKLQTTLKGQIETLSPNDYIKAKRYLTEIDDTIKALQDPQVGKMAARKWADQTSTVGDLVAQMTSQGLKFAPAVSGDQAAYVALHSGMVAYQVGMNPQLTANAR